MKDDRISYELHGWVGDEGLEVQVGCMDRRVTSQCSLKWVDCLLLTNYRGYVPCLMGGYLGSSLVPNC